jgi:hypothetical protein
MAASTANATNDQFARVSPNSDQSTFEQSPPPRKIIGSARLSGKVSIMPYRSRPHETTSGGFHWSQLCDAAV